MKFKSIIVILFLFFMIALVTKNTVTVNKFHSTVEYTDHSITDGNDKVLEQLEDDISIYEHFSTKVFIIPEIAPFMRKAYKLSSLNFAIWNPPKISI